MTVQTLRGLLRQQPFRPFRLVMSSGQTYEVRRPESAFRTRDALFVGVDETDEGVSENFKIRSLLHVAAVEPIEADESRQAGAS